MWAGDGGVTKEQRLGTVIGKLRTDLTMDLILFWGVCSGVCLDIAVRLESRTE